MNKFYQSYSNLKIKNNLSFKFMKNLHILFAFVLFASFLIIFFINPSSCIGTSDNQILYYGFYSNAIVGNSFSHLYINWIAIIMTLFTIAFLIYSGVYYWIYWNSEWKIMVSNNNLIAFIILSSLFSLLSLIFSYINIPLINFEILDKNIGFDNSDLITGSINFNLGYNFYFIKGSSGNISYCWYELNNYGLGLVFYSIIFSIGLLTSYIFLIFWK